MKLMQCFAVTLTTVFLTHGIASAQNVFTVTNTNDGGAGSLLQALIDANATPNVDASTPDEIAFDIPGGAVHQIPYTGSHLRILDPVVIDGSTQPGFSGTPVITVKGVNAGHCFLVESNGSGSTIRHLAIRDFGNQAIWLNGNGGNLIEHNYIGTDQTGTVAAGNGAGILIGYYQTSPATSNSNVIRNNVIADSVQRGIECRADGNLIENNLVGIDVTGQFPLPNGRANLELWGSDNTVKDNVLAECETWNVGIWGDGNHLTGNYIGTDSSGTVALDEGEALLIFSGTDNVIGEKEDGTGTGNVISAINNNWTVAFRGGSGSTRIAGNWIGTDETGIVDLDNNTGIAVVASVDSVDIVANTIGFQNLTGIWIGVSSTGIRMSENAIYEYGNFGINLGSDGITANDDGDPDTGPNDFQNFPLLTLVQGGASTRVVGVLNSEPLQDYIVEFFASSWIHSSFHGGTERYLGSTVVTTDGLNQGTFDIVLPAGTSGGEWITATATDTDGNTSELSLSLQVTNSDPIADAGMDQSVECDETGTTTTTLDGTGSSDPDGDVLTFEWSEPAGVSFDDPSSATPTGTFPIGNTLVTLTVTDGKGGVDVDDVLITVVDTSPPEVNCTTDVASLWPPNHQMEDVSVSILATDACTDPGNLVLVAVEITSNEPDNATGDGNTDGDVNGEDGYVAPVDVTDLFAYDAVTESFEGTVELRAERAGSGTGRTYTITAYVIDSANNVASTSCSVVVPHDRRGKK